MADYTAPELFEAVRRMLPVSAASALPKAEAGQNFEEVAKTIGEILGADPSLANAWHNTAFNLIAAIELDSNEIHNPLADYTGSTIAEGAMIEEMIIDTAKASVFNPSKAETTLFERKTPELYARVYSESRDVYLEATIQDSIINEMFLNPNQLDGYVHAVIQSLVSGNNAEKFYTTKRLVSKAIADGAVRLVDLGTAVTVPQIQEAILTLTDNMQFPSRDYNTGIAKQTISWGTTFDTPSVVTSGQGVQMQALKSNLRIMMTAALKRKLDVNFFAQVFHGEMADAELLIKTVDSFPAIYEYNKDHTVVQADLDGGFLDPEEWSVGDTVPQGTAAKDIANADVSQIFNPGRLIAFIHDARALRIRPVLPEMINSQANPKGRYINIFLHDKTRYGYSPFHPAVAIFGDVATSTPTPLSGNISIDGVEVTDNNITASQDANDAQ